MFHVIVFLNDLLFSRAFSKKFYGPLSLAYLLLRCSKVVHINALFHHLLYNRECFLQLIFIASPFTIHLLKRPALYFFNGGPFGKKMSNLKSI